MRAVDNRNLEIENDENQIEIENIQKCTIRFIKNIFTTKFQNNFEFKLKTLKSQMTRCCEVAPLHGT